MTKRMKLQKSWGELLFNAEALRKDAWNIYYGLSEVVQLVFIVPLLFISVLLAFPCRFAVMFYGKVIGIKAGGGTA